MKMIHVCLLLIFVSFFDHSLIKSAQKEESVFQNRFKLLYRSLLTSNLEEFYTNLLTLAQELNPEELKLLLNHKISDGKTLIQILIGMKPSSDQSLQEQEVFKEKQTLCLQALFNDGANFFLKNNAGKSAMDLLQEHEDQEFKENRSWVIDRLLFDSNDSYLKNAISEIGLTELIATLIDVALCFGKFQKTLYNNQDRLEKTLNSQELNLQQRLILFAGYYVSFSGSVGSLKDDDITKLKEIKKILHKMSEISLQNSFDFEPITFDMNYMLTSNFLFLFKCKYFSLLSYLLFKSMPIDFKIDLLKEMLSDSFHIDLNRQRSLEQNFAIFDVFNRFVSGKISLDDAILLWQEFFNAGANINVMQVDSRTERNHSVFSLIIKDVQLSTTDRQRLIKFFLDNGADLHQESFLIVVEHQTLERQYVAQPLLLTLSTILSADELDVILSHPEFKAQECDINALYEIKTMMRGQISSTFLTMLESSLKNIHETRLIKTLIKHGANINQSVSPSHDDLPICFFAQNISDLLDKDCHHVLGSMLDLISDPDLKLLIPIGESSDLKSIPDFVKSYFDNAQKKHSQEVKNEFKSVFDALKRKYDSQKRDQEKIESDIQKEKAALVQAKKDEEARVKAAKLAFQQEKDRAIAEEKNEEAKKQRLEALQKNFENRQALIQRNYQAQEIKLSEQLKNSQDEKEKLQNLGKKISAVSADLSSYDLLKQGNLNDFSRNKIKHDLKNLSLNFLVPVSAKYQLKVPKIASKERVFVDMHHIMSAKFRLI